MAVGYLRLRVRVRHKLSLAAAMPERYGQHAHQRAVAIVMFPRGPCLEGRHAALQRLERTARLYADIEDLSIDGHIAISIPGEEALSHILDVKPTALQKRCKKTERARAIVRPRTREDASMRS